MEAKKFVVHFCLPFPLEIDAEICFSQKLGRIPSLRRAHTGSKLSRAEKVGFVGFNCPAQQKLKKINFFSRAVYAHEQQRSTTSLELLESGINLLHFSEDFALGFRLPRRLVKKGAGQNGCTCA